jgi:sRNA-binding carbon storage regulator CsrA
MLVHKRRPGQGIVLDGVLSVTVTEIAPEVWLSIEAIAVGVAPVISATSSAAGDKIVFGIRAPMSFTSTEETTTVTTSPNADPQSQLTLPLPRHHHISVDGIDIEIDKLDGGEHHGKALLHIHSPGLDPVIDLAVLTRYHYAIDLATDAPSSTRIYRSEVWKPAAESNEDAANWSSDDARALQGRSPLTA